MQILIASDSCNAYVYFDDKTSHFGKDPLNMVMMKHVSDDPIRKNLLYFRRINKSDSCNLFFDLVHNRLVANSLTFVLEWTD